MVSGDDRVRSIHDLDDWSLAAVTTVAAREPVDLGTFCDEEVVLLDRGAPSLLDAPRLSQWDEECRQAAITAVTSLLVSRGELVVDDEIEVWGTMAPLHDLRAAASERVVLHPLPPETAPLFAVVERLGDSDLATVRLVDPGDGIHWVVVTTVLRAMAIAMGRLQLLEADDLPADLDRLTLPDPDVQWARDPDDLAPDPIQLATESDQAVVVLAAEPGGDTPEELGTLTRGPRGLHLVAEVGSADDPVHSLTMLAPGEALGLLAGAVRGLRAAGLARPDPRANTDATSASGDVE